MRILSDKAINPERIVLPVVEYFPDNPIIGEMVYFNRAPRQAVYLFNGEGWVSLYSTRNNHWETIIAEPQQKVFELKQEYDCDGNSLIVYKDGVKLHPNDYVEAGRNLVTYRGKDKEGEDIDIEGGEEFQFQVFNIRQTGTFNVKSFNRRKGISHDDI